MELKTERLQQLWLLSDTVLYPDAVRFMRRFVDEYRYTMPPSQLMGLLHNAHSTQYADIQAFIEHQRARDWQGRKRATKNFYEDLGEYLTRLRKQRIQQEFRLVTPRTQDEELDALTLLLAREFIQHLIAENGLIGAEQKRQQGQQTRGRR